jgi:hypothetical protein
MPASDSHSHSALNDLVGIEDGVGVERLLERPHDVHRDRILDGRQQVALEQADAVFGRDRAPLFLDDREHDIAHVVPAS